MSDTTDDESEPTPETTGGSRNPADHLAPHRFQPGHNQALTSRAGVLARLRRKLKDGELLEDLFISVATGQIEGRTSDRLEAGKVLWDRAYGKAVDVSVTLDARSPAADMPPETLEALARELRRDTPPAAFLERTTPGTTPLPHNATQHGSKECATSEVRPDYGSAGPEAEKPPEHQ